MNNDKKTKDIVSEFEKVQNEKYHQNVEYYLQECLEHGIENAIVGNQHFKLPKDNSPKNWCEFKDVRYYCTCGYCKEMFYSPSKAQICKECYPEHLVNFKKQQMLELKPKFEKVVEMYIDAFCEKQELVFSFWISDDVGSVAYFNEIYLLYFDDIRYDIDYDIPKGKIIEYSFLSSENKMSYKNFCKIEPSNETI